MRSDNSQAATVQTSGTVTQGTNTAWYSFVLSALRTADDIEQRREKSEQDNTVEARELPLERQQGEGMEEQV